MRTPPRLIALAVAALFGGPALAQKDPGPAVEVRLRSVNDLLDKGEYLGDLVNQGEAARQGVGFLRSVAGTPKGIEGVDPAKPFGLYATITRDVVDSPVVLMVPLADESAFLDLLTNRLNLEPKKKDGGVYEVRVPNVPAPVYFRSSDGYVYATLNDPKHLDGVIAPKAFFAEADDAVLSAKVHLDRIPADVRKTVLGQFELQMADARKEQQPGETPAQFRLRGWAVEQLVGAVAAALGDGRDLTVRMRLDPKSDDLSAEVTFIPREGSRLGQAIRRLDGRSGVAASVATPNALAAGGVKLGVPDEATKELGAVVDLAVKEALANAKGGPERQALKLLLEAVTPTLKAGELDAGFAITGPDDKGRVALVAGLKVVEGGRVERTLKQFAPFLPEEKAKVEFDVEKVGGLTLHKATVSDDNLEQAFGTRTVWLATGEDRLLLSVEPGGRAIRSAAEKEPGKVDVAALDVAVVRALSVAEKGLKPDTLKELAAEAFGATGPGGRDFVRLRLTGGESLRLRFTIKGKAFKYGVLVDQAKKQGQ